jgi:hypothetical protein
MLLNQQRRGAAIASYLQDPNYCRECGSLISVPEGRKVSQVRAKQFCNSSCANAFNNRLHPRGRPPRKAGLPRPPRQRRIKETSCRDCGCTVHSPDARRKLSEECYRLARFPGGKPFPELTKAELFARRSSWQSARNSIRLHAQRVFARSGLPATCVVCGYALHVDIAHRHPVRDFPDTAKMKEINALDNLAPLCPTHHWEHDHGFLSLASYPSEKLYGEPAVK